MEATCSRCGQRHVLLPDWLGLQDQPSPQPGLSGLLAGLDRNKRTRQKSQRDEMLPSLTKNLLHGPNLCVPRAHSDILLF